MINGAKFGLGQNVRVISTDKIGTINKIIEKSTAYGYKVMIDGKTNTYAEKYLEAFIDEENEIIESFELGEFGDNNDLALFETWFRLKKPIEGNLYSYLGSKTLFNPYQFKPLLKFIAPNSEERLFIADEVGVGKTIESGILLMELLARGRIERNHPVLIVCPNVLGPKWVKEMDKRFNFRFHLHDSKSLENMFKIHKDSKYIQNPWGVVSLQLLRTPKFMKYLQEISALKVEPLWSLVIVDEAHHMRNNGTESNLVGQLLSELTQMMVMLSATPLNLRDEDLFNQMTILNPSLFPDKQTFEALISPVKSLNKMRRLLAEKVNGVENEIFEELNRLSTAGIGKTIRNHPGIQQLEERIKTGVLLTSSEIAYFDRVLRYLSPLDSSFTRTLKRESMSHRVTREVLKVPVKFSNREYNFYMKTVEAIQKAYLHKGGNPIALGFATNMPMRMLSSSIPAMRNYLLWALENNTVIEDNPFDEEDEDLTSERPLSPELRQIFNELLEESEKLADEDTKLKEFETLVKRMMNALENKQIIVFSFFRRTLKYLKDALTSMGYRAEIISGEVPLTTTNGVVGRYEIMEKFENKEIDILLSSEVGGEGLDFQFCQALINYDMPYNPMRVEQRIGRLDRFGQQADKVFVANMYLEGTVDEKIYNLLYERIQLIEDSVGFLEPIIGIQLVDLQKGILENTLTEEQIEKRTREIEIAIAQAKNEHEKFELSRNELLGDEKISDTIANMTMTDFVKPVDSMRLTKIFLENRKDCNFIELESDYCEIILNPELLVEIEEFTRAPGNDGSMEELYPLLKAKKGIQVIFNGQKSLEKPRAVFLPPSGYWMKFILKYLEDHSKIYKVFQVKGSSDDFQLETGRYFVPLFEVTFEGFRTELNLAAVPLYLKTKEIPSVNNVDFMRLLGQKAKENAYINIEDECEELIEVARSALENQMEIKLEELKIQHAYIVDSKINSLKKGFEVRRDRIQNRLENHKKTAMKEGKSPSEEYFRLVNGQIEKDQKRTEDRVSKILDNNQVILSISLVGLTLLEIGEDEVD